MYNIHVIHMHINMTIIIYVLHIIDVINVIYHHSCDITDMCIKIYEKI